MKKSSPYAPALATRLRKAGFSVHQDQSTSALRVAAAKHAVHITVDFPSALVGMVSSDLRSQLLEWGYAVSEHPQEPSTLVVSQ